jgi:hypothetical protein
LPTILRSDLDAVAYAEEEAAFPDATESRFVRLATVNRKVFFSRKIASGS